MKHINLNEIARLEALYLALASQGGTKEEVDKARETLENAEGEYYSAALRDLQPDWLTD